ncbi:nitroreductase family deazaflavin-dependent oxidoreductase [Microbacterium halotolerans]|uniref:nitroreductase family deazaflavin-dependent oxidoreductase n=1 Tax=Microbacterium halotolerans TaxID=246613 RepID=UPI000E6A9985|nr:nitroreductase family deazaflavin-dependent oxidoreductase [Microbacterium halotolerans]
MRRRALIALGTTIVIVVAPLAALVLALRTKWEPGVALVRRLGRDRFNRGAMRTAGTPGASAQVIRTVGRRSGRPYRTPIGLRRTQSGWIVTLPYGTTPDWLKNLLAAGSAEVETEGEVRAVTAPRVVPRHDVMHLLGTGDRVVAHLFGVDECLLLEDAPTASA